MSLERYQLAQLMVGVWITYKRLYPKFYILYYLLLLPSQELMRPQYAVRRANVIFIVPQN